MTVVHTALSLLVVEDILCNASVATRLLEHRGHLVTAVSDGHAAVEEAVANTYDLILMDIRLPRLDGLEALRRIGSILGSRRPPAVAVTADVFSVNWQACRDAGFQDYVIKPYRAADLITRVERLGRRAAD